MPRQANRLDQVTKLLRDQLRYIEHEERELRRAKDRVLKALGLFVKDTPQGHKLSGPKGPMRRDSHTIVMDAIKAAFAPGHVFHRRQVYELQMRETLRWGQMSGGIDTLRRTGVLKRGDKKGYYYYGEKNGNES